MWSTQYLANNPVHQSLPALAELATMKWDDGNEYFPPTSFQIPNVHGDWCIECHSGEFNVQFNLRFSTELTADEIKRRVHSTLDAHGLDYDLTDTEWPAILNRYRTA